MPCTTLLVGKDASYDGSTIVSRSEDSPSGQFNPKRFIVVLPDDQPREYISQLSNCKVILPDNPMRYTAFPDTCQKKGNWYASGVNEKNVAMTATETIITNALVQAADPLLESPCDDKKYGGLSEEDFVTIVLPYISSAKEGVIRLGQLLEEHGTYESNGIAFQDEDEIWWLETIGGHHWIARRVPDGAYVVMPNQLGINYFDFDDAFGEQENFMCSSDLREWTLDNFMAKDLGEGFNPRLAYGSHSAADHVYNTPRAWYMLRYFNPRSFKWDGIDADYKPESDDLPWCCEPEHPITIEDMKAVLSSHYEGTDFDCYSKHSDPQLKGMYRPIGISRQNVTHFTQIRPYMPEEIKSIQWMAFGSNAFNAVAPFYVNISKTPDYLANPSKKPTTNSLYWTSRIIAALSDAHFNKTSAHIERYQNKVMYKCSELIHKFDEQVILDGIKDVVPFLEQANQEISDYLEEKTIECLDEVLYSASCEMKNGFARSDN